MTNAIALPDHHDVSGNCGCFITTPPPPMGCALCGHAPHAHGCTGTHIPDHTYVVPSGSAMAERLEARRRTGPHYLSTYEPPAEAISLVPACRKRRDHLPVGQPEWRRWVA